MAQPRFNLKNRNASGPTPVFLFYQYGPGRPLKFYFDRQVVPDQWDFLRRRVKAKHPYATVFNKLLQKIQDAAVRIVDEHQIKGHLPTPDQLRKLLSAEIGQVQASDSLVGFMKALIEERKNDKRYKTGSIQVYRNCLKHVEAFRPHARFDDVDMNFFHSFCQYLYKQKNPKGTHFSRNHVNKIVSTLKMIMTEARDAELHTNIAYQSRKFSVPKVETTKIYLTEVELDRIYRKPMPSDGLERARDCLIVLAYTGVRDSDLDKIGRENFIERDGLRYFHFRMHKGSAPVSIPVHPLVEKVLDKYDWKLPSISNQRLNEHVKDVGRVAGLTNRITVTTYPAGERHDALIEKCDLITTHTGRRSLCSNLYKAGFATETIMKISGHRSHASFMKYLRLSHEDHLHIVKGLGFFASIPKDARVA